MATTLAVTDVSFGLNVTGGDVAYDAGGTRFPNDGNVFLRATNTSGGALGVSFGSPVLIDGMALTPTATSIPAGIAKLFGPFPTSVFNQPDGTVIVFADSAGIQFRCFRLPNVS
jgi:hypothetical protein